MSRLQPSQTIRTSEPTRRTLKNDVPQGCFFFSSSLSPTEIFGMFTAAS